jgi:hypothetical protein
MRGVKSVRISGLILAGSSPATLQLDVVPGKGGRGEFSAFGQSIRFIKVGQLVYVNAPPAFWRRFAGEATARRLNGKWLRAPASTARFASLTRMISPRQLLPGRVGHTKLTRGPTSTVDGEKVIAVKYAKQPGTVYVATTGKPYLIAITGPQHVHVTFDRFDKPVSLAPPANAIDISTVQPLR